jgi:hypothetical protein
MFVLESFFFVYVGEFFFVYVDEVFFPPSNICCQIYLYFYQIKASTLHLHTYKSCTSIYWILNKLFDYW